MMLWGSQIAPLVEVLKRFGIDNRAALVDHVEKLGARWKYPSADPYNSAVGQRRDYARGRQLIHATKVLAKYFPKAHESMVPHVVPFFSHLVDQVSTRYLSAPTREIVVGGKPDEAATTAMRELYAASRVDIAMRGVERIATSALVGFVRVGWSSDRRCPTLTPFWPDKVDVVCDPEHPDDIQRSSFVLAEVLSDAGLTPTAGQETYEIWARQPNNWRRILITKSGDKISPLELDDQEDFPFLPWATIHFDDPEGQMFPPLPTDDIATADMFTAQYTNRDHLITMQAHAQYWMQGPDAEEAHEWKTGPDVVWTLQAGEVGMLQANPPLEAISTSLQHTMERELLLRGASPAQATADPKYMAALALRTLNQTRDERREARLPYAVDTEQRQLWPVFRAVVEHYSSTKFPSGCEMRVGFGKLSTPIDDQGDWNLSFQLIREGASTLPREMVKHNMAPNEDVALEQLKANAELNALVRGLSGAPEPDADAQAPEDDPGE